MVSLKRRAGFTARKIYLQIFRCERYSIKKPSSFSRPRHEDGVTFRTKACHPVFITGSVFTKFWHGFMLWCLKGISKNLFSRAIGSVRKLI
jgi:hypothetical protein